jgi:UDP-N-acetylmuramoyl-L-alanine---L-glutamate ligase
MEPLRISDLAGRQIGVWGLGEEGESVLRALGERLPGQQVTVFDEAAAPSAATERWRAAPHVRLESGPRTGDDLAERLAELDVVIKSPGVSLYRPEVAAARAAGVRFTSATGLWFAELGAASLTVAVTGTKGKTTTASLVGHLLSAAGKRVEVAGNIGRPLLDLLDLDAQLELGPEVWVVELSSYQIADLEASPAWAVLLNLFPEHLDWHGGVEAYYRDKLRLFRRLPPGRAVINARDPETEKRRDVFRSPVLFDDPAGFHVVEDTLYYAGQRLLGAEALQLAGRHNLVNVCAALTVTALLGVSLEGSIAALPSFRPSRHRLSRLGERDGVTWVDDSISTVPQSAIAGIAAFPGCPLTLLVGGFDRGLEYRALAEAVLARPVEVVITLPDSGPRIAAEIESERARAAGSETPSGRLAGGSPRVLESRDLEHAVELARQVTPAGGVVLLSPAAASYGRFKDHRERGRRFAELAGFAAV